MKMPEAKAGVVPELRFPEFRDAGPWEVKRLGDRGIARFIRDRVAAEDVPSGHYVSTVNLLPDFGGLSPEPEKPPPGSAVAYREGDILMSNIRPYLRKVWVADRTGGASNDVLVARPGKSVVKSFLSQLLMSERFISHVMDGAKGVKMPRGDLEQIQDFAVPLPAKPEQQKIADCLFSLDDLIRAEGERLAALRDHKRGLMQRLFPAPGQTTPRLRFPEFRDAGPWGVKRLGEVAVRVTDRNSPGHNTRVLTNSAELGVVHQREFFNKDIAAKENLARYTVVEIDDFVYNPRISASAPVGPISRNKIALGVMSPLYTIFRFRAGCLDFLEFFFQTNVWHPYLRAVGSTGARHDRLSISVRDFFSLPVLFPIEAEQQKIADCLTSLDDLITALEARLAALQAHKRGLMQQLFPQKVG